MINFNISFSKLVNKFENVIVMQTLEWGNEDVAKSTLMESTHKICVSWELVEKVYDMFNVFNGKFGQLSSW